MRAPEPLHRFLTRLRRTVNVVAEHLAPVVPSRGDRVKVRLAELLLVTIHATPAPR